MRLSNIWVCYGWLKARSCGWEWEGGTNTKFGHTYFLVAYYLFFGSSATKQKQRMEPAGLLFNAVLS